MSGFESSRYVYGGTGRKIIGLVVNRKDPEESGRVQVRSVGFQGDKAMIPDAQLPWARCSFPVSNPMNGGISGPVTGLMEGSYVQCSHMDAHGQQVMVDSSIGKAGEDNGKGGLDTSGRKHSTNPHTRTAATGGGDKRFKTSDPNHAEGEFAGPIHEYAVAESKNVYGDAAAKDPQGFSLGLHAYK